MKSTWLWICKSSCSYRQMELYDRCAGSYWITTPPKDAKTRYSNLKPEFLVFS